MTLQVSCPVCGMVTIKPSDVALVICSNANLSTYTFICPTCGDELRKPACDLSISKLLQAGVRPTLVTIPAELLEPHDGPTLTSDDWLDLAVALHDSADVAGIALAELAAH